MTEEIKNEVAVAETHEVATQAAENNTYSITQNADGKFQRKAIYKEFSSVRPESRAQKIALLQLLESDDIATPLNKAVGQKIEIADVIIRPYDSLNEETGELEYGVLTYMITPDGEAFVTSSKSVYYTLQNVFTVFGLPHYEGEEVVIAQVVKKKGLQYEYTDINIIG